MIHAFTLKSGYLCSVPGDQSADGAIWFDLLRPSREEEVTLEQAFGLDVPTPEEMAVLESSSRLHTKDGNAFMTASLVCEEEGGTYVTAPVTFVLQPERLLTVRHGEPGVVRSFLARAEREPLEAPTPLGILSGLLETTTERAADLLREVGEDVDKLSKDVFRRSDNRPRPAKEYRHILVSIGEAGDTLSALRDSLASLDRLHSFLIQVLDERQEKAMRGRIKTLSRDAASLGDHADFLSQKVLFLLDATLGMVSIEQNAIIKIFSVAAVVFLPPTLIASIYGMNFEFMPELDWRFGYPVAISLMIVFAILPYLYFKKRGWL